MAAAFWWIGLASNAVVAAAYIAVATLLLVNAVRTHHVRDNPLGVATVLVFFTCGAGHAVHMVQLLDGPTTAAGAAIAAEYVNNVHMVVIDVLTAIAGVSYWMLRRRFPALVSGAAVFEDLRARQRRALEINDNIVQGLARAKLALDLGKNEDGDEAVEETLAKARHIITDLLGKDEVPAGGLRRQSSGGVHGR